MYDPASLLIVTYRLFTPALTVGFCADPRLLIRQVSPDLNRPSNGRVPLPEDDPGRTHCQGN